MKTLLLISVAILYVSMARGQLLLRLTNTELQSQTQASFGSAWIDYNGDQLPDPYFTHVNSITFFYENLGGSAFRFIGSNYPNIGQSSLSGISWGDIDNDGLNDMYVCTMGGFNYLMKNKGEGRFERIQNNQAVKDNGTYLQSSFIDYNNDGWLDIFAPTVTSLNFVKSAGRPNFLYRNNGTGDFEKATESGLMSDNTNTTCASFADYDNDGDQDLFMTEFFKDNWFYENNGNGTFTRITGSAINLNDQMSLSCSWADYDNDGYMDLLVCNGSVSASVKAKNYLFHNNGDKTFTKLTKGAIAEYYGCSWSSAWGDLDNDGDLDIYMGTEFEDDMIFLNNGDGTFIEYTDFTRNNNTTGVCLGDYDNDGFLDVLLSANNMVDQGHVIYHNNGNGNNWINLTLKGTNSNISGIGAKTKIKATINGKPCWQYRELNGNQGLRGFNDLRVHFGLGDATVIDSIVVMWPSKDTTILVNVEPNKLMTIVEEIPEKFLRPAFVADTLIGRGKLTVQFTDKSLFDPKNPVIKWSWDFDGDGIEDSNLPNPLYTFQNDTGQIFSPALTISNGYSSKSIKRNNFIQIFPFHTDNISIWNKATASSNESESYSPSGAVDGDISTRWASEFKDNQWFKVELDSNYVIGKIIIKWENAYAREYEIQTSTNNENWETIYSELKGNGATDILLFNPDTAKYVQINLQKRGTSYGFSFYEFEIYRSDGTIYTSVEEMDIKKNEMNIHPNPVNDFATISLTLSSPSDVNISIFDITGRTIKTIAFGNFDQGIVHFDWDRTNNDLQKVNSGVYICRIETNSNKQIHITRFKLLVN
jgi:enediyne biosynthesis protein E4